MSEKAKELSVLMPPPTIEGGLIIRKKNPEADSHQFKVPLPLGLYFCNYIYEILAELQYFSNIKLTLLEIISTAK